jgi:UDP-glucose 4-epimerase
MGVEPEIVHLPARQEAHHAHSSHDRLTATFGRRRLTPLDEGLKKMAEWARSHGVRSSETFDDLEVTKNLPEAWRAT